MRKANQATIDLIKSFEGLFLKVYLDPVKIPTIGYGTIMYPNGKKVTMADAPITEAQAVEYLTHEVNEKAAGVEKLVKVPLNDNEFGALVSFSYNVGTQALGSSTLLRLLNAGKKAEAAEQFLRWDKAGGKVLAGLTRRRKAERELFLKAEAGTKDPGVLGNGPSEADINITLEDIEKEALKNK